MKRSGGLYASRYSGGDDFFFFPAVFGCCGGAATAANFVVCDGDCSDAYFISGSSSLSGDRFFCSSSSSELLEYSVFEPLESPESDGLY